MKRPDSILTSYYNNQLTKAQVGKETKTSQQDSNLSGAVKTGIGVGAGLGLGYIARNHPLVSTSFGFRSI